MIKYFAPFFLSVLLFAFTGSFPTDCSPGDGDALCAVPTDQPCTLNGIELKGKVQFVESFPDIRIQIVESFPDLRVKLVEAFPDDCGEWQVVESFPDFKVQVVESFPDLKVKYVESFPGLP